MTDKTSLGLVEYVKRALNEKWGYVLGTFGNTATRTLLDQKYVQGGGVGTYNSKHRAYIETFLGKRVSDCYGLVKGYVWTEGNGEPRYNANGKLDRNQEGAFLAAEEKGPIASIPEIPGLLLWMRGHAGVYIGNGEFIECIGAPVGMRRGRIQNGRVVSGSPFTHWFKDNFIEYQEDTGLDVREAIDVLVKEKVIASPDYWLQNYDKLKYLDRLIVNMANRLRE